MEEGRRRLVSARVPGAPAVTGHQRQLFAAAAKAVEPAAALSAPLWRFHWFDGLEGGRFAFMITRASLAMGRHRHVPPDGETLPDSPKVRTIRAPWEGVSTWQRRDKPKEAGPSAVAKATNLIRSVRAVADVSKAFTQHGTGLGRGQRASRCRSARPKTEPTRQARASAPMA